MLKLPAWRIASATQRAAPEGAFQGQPRVSTLANRHIEHGCDPDSLLDPGLFICHTMATPDIPPCTAQMCNTQPTLHLWPDLSEQCDGVTEDGSFLIFWYIRADRFFGFHRMVYPIGWIIQH